MLIIGMDMGSKDGDATVLSWRMPDGRMVVCPPYIPVDWLDRITPEVDADGKVHLLWTGWNNGEGHGKVRVNGKARYTHREVVERVEGRKLSRFDYVDYRCARKPCLNYDCLEVVPPGENTRRGPGAQQQFKPAEAYAPSAASPATWQEPLDGL